jgi:hypothetical protein
MRITPLQNTEQGMAHVWLLHVPLPTALEREEGEGDQKKKQVGALATVEEELDVLLRPSRLRLPFHPPHLGVVHIFAITTLPHVASFIV